MFQSSKRTLAQQLAEAGLPAFVYHFTDPDAVPVAEFTPAVAAPNSLGSKYDKRFYCKPLNKQFSSPYV